CSLLRSVFMKETANLNLKIILVHHPGVRLGNLAVAINEQSERHVCHTKLRSQIVIANHDRIVQLVICEEWLHRSPSIRIHGDTDSGESGVPIFVLELNVPRNFGLAASAPSCPKIEQDHFSPVCGQSDGGTVSVSKREIGSGFACGSRRG